jgi:hypothetical protein
VIGITILMRVSRSTTFASFSRQNVIFDPSGRSTSGGGPAHVDADLLHPGRLEQLNIK